MSQSRPVILLFDNNEKESDFFSKIIENDHKSCIFYRLNDINQVLPFLNKEESYSNLRIPDIIIFSISLVNSEIINLIHNIKNTSPYIFIPLIIFSDDISSEKIYSLYDLHVNACIIKPDNIEKFNENFSSVINFWLEIVRLPHNIN